MKKSTLFFPVLFVAMFVCSCSRATDPLNITITPTFTGPPSTATESPVPVPATTRTATVSPSATPTEVIPTIPNTPTPEQGSKTVEVLYLYLQDSGSYAYYDYQEAAEAGWLPPENYLMMPLSYHLTFAHYKDRVVYVKPDGNIWLADLDVGDQEVIYQIQEEQIEAFQLFWSPDDELVFMDYLSADVTDYVYHLKTGELETWEFSCNAMAMSPKTGTIATWCRSGDGKFAVIEWGGEIWYTDSSPENVLVTAYEDGEVREPQLFPLYLNAGWAADGSQAAFFDPEDKGTALQIVDANGKTLYQLPQRAFWLSWKESNVDFLPGNHIQWSQNGERVLFFGLGEEQQCPEETDINGEVHANTACWQVFDVLSGRTVWTIGDLAAQEPDERKQSNYGPSYEAPTISSTGDKLAVYSPAPGDTVVYVIDIDKNQILSTPMIAYIRARWGSRVK